MRTRRVLLHLVLATLTWSIFFALLSALRPLPTAPIALVGAPGLEVPASTVQAAPIPEPVHLPEVSSSDLRVKERTLTASADRDSIVDAIVDLYRYHFCRIGEDATLRRLDQLLSRNPRVTEVNSRSGSLDFRMKDGFSGTLMLYTATPDCP